MHIGTDGNNYCHHDDHHSSHHKRRHHLKSDRDSDMSMSSHHGSRSYSRRYDRLMRKRGRGDYEVLLEHMIFEERMAVIDPECFSPLNSMTFNSDGSLFVLGYEEGMLFLVVFVVFDIYL